MIVAVLLPRSVVVLKGHERGVVYRLGKLTSKVIGPGLAFVAPLIDRVQRVSLEEQRVDLPAAEVRTRNGSTTTVAMSLRYRILDPVRSVSEIQNVRGAVAALGETALRAAVGAVDYDPFASDSQPVASAVRQRMDEQAERWGVKVLDVELDRRRFAAAVRS